jgi:hypothetical protein
VGSASEALACLPPSAIATLPVWTLGTTYNQSELVQDGGRAWSCIQAQCAGQAAWEPGATGTSALWQAAPACNVAPWAQPVAYEVGDIVTYGGFAYQCILAHTSEPGWTPDVTPALWTRIELLPGPETFDILVPVGVGIDRVVLGTNGTLTIGSSATVSGSTGTLVTNAASTSTLVGSNAKVPTVDSVASVRLNNGAQVGGDVTTAGTLSRGSSTVVSGTISQQATLTPLFAVHWTATPPALTKANVSVASGASLTLAPGSYETVHLAGNSQLTLTTGTYFVDDFDVGPSAVVVVQHQQQPVLLYVEEEMQLHGTFSDGGDPSHLLIGYSGTIPLGLSSPFRGTLVAPGIGVTLSPASVAHVGAILAHDVSLQPGTSVQFTSFAHWGLFVAPIPTVTCVAQFNATSYGALFGYKNLLQTPIVVAAGSDNQFVPSVPNFAPLATFAPGTHTGVTTVPMRGGAAETWKIRNQTVQATTSTLPRCNGSEANLGQGPAAGPGLPNRAGPASPSALSRLHPDVP